MSGTRVARAETGEGLLDTRYGVPLLGISRDRDSLDRYRSIFLPGQSLPPQVDNTCGFRNVATWPWISNNGCFLVSECKQKPD